MNEYERNLPETNFDNPLGCFAFTGLFNGYFLGMELYDHARCYELRTPSPNYELIATGYSAASLPKEFPPSAVEAIEIFERWIYNTEQGE